MPIRHIPICTGQWYHIYDRGVDRAPIFRSEADYQHLYDALDYYRFRSVPVRFSYYLELSIKRREQIQTELRITDPLITVGAFAYMKTHFHLLVKQCMDDGIHIWLHKALDSYTRYMNTKYYRVGPLCQSMFQLQPIDSDEQLIHTSRYIHLNPVAAGIMSIESLEQYPWTSYPIYLGSKSQCIDPSEILPLVGDPEQYRSFVKDHAHDQMTESYVSGFVSEDVDNKLAFQANIF